MAIDFNQYNQSLTISYTVPDAIKEVLDMFVGRADSVLAEVVEATAQQAEVQWAMIARNYLKNADGYVKAIEQVRISPTHILVKNTHAAAWFLELGTSPFDMKRMLDTSSKVKITKDGKRYIRIPLDGKVKDFIAAGVNDKDLARMRGTKFVGVVKDGREQKIITEYGDRLRTEAGGRQRKLFTVLNAPRDKFPNKTNSPNMGFSEPYTEYKAATVIDYTWKASKFQNAVKMVDFQGRTVGMKTFRTISDASDPNSWIHPGIRASHMAELTAEQVRPQFTAQMAESLQPLVDNLTQTLQRAGLK